MKVYWLENNQVVCSTVRHLAVIDEKGKNNLILDGGKCFATFGEAFHKTRDKMEIKVSLPESEGSGCNEP